MAEIAKIHGNDIRDKKLVDAQVSTTPSDVTSNSVIPVEAEDGTIIKLKRDSLVQAFASVLNSNSQSTITTVFGADANGNHANINMYNLAVALSVGQWPLHQVANVDLNGYLDSNESYFIVGSCTNGPGTTTNRRGILICKSAYNSGRFAAQLYIETIGKANKIYLRTYDDAWATWKEL